MPLFIAPHNLRNDEKGIYYIHLIKSVSSNNATCVGLFSLAVLITCIVSEFSFVAPKVRSGRAKRDTFRRFTWAISFCMLPEICYITSRIFGLNLCPLTAQHICGVIHISLLDLTI